MSELRGTTVPFNSLQAAVSRNMLESLKVAIPSELRQHELRMCFMSSPYIMHYHIHSIRCSYSRCQTCPKPSDEPFGAPCLLPTLTSPHSTYRSRYLRLYSLRV